MGDSRSCAEQIAQLEQENSQLRNRVRDLERALVTIANGITNARTMLSNPDMGGKYLDLAHEMLVSAQRIAITVRR